MEGGGEEVRGELRAVRIELKRFCVFYDGRYELSEPINIDEYK